MITARQIKAELGRRFLLDFTKFTKPDYKANWHHKKLCEKLDLFAEGKIKKLMVFMPPQHGKSELTTRRFPAFMLGKNPNKRIAIASYSSTYAKSFNLSIQRIIDSTEYNEMFPGTTLNSSNVSDVKDTGAKLRNAHIFEIVDKQGSLRVTGVEGGSLTGHPVDIFIMDDPYASREEALSRAINESVWSFYVNVARMRMHNNSQELLVMTRWHGDDVASRLLKQESDWEVVRFPAIKEKADDNDPRNLGEALWTIHLDIDNLNAIKKLSPTTFDASYQQDPKAPKDILVYPTWGRAAQFPDPARTFLALDFGYVNDPTAMVEMQVLKGPRTKVYVKELIYKTNLSNKQIKRETELQKINPKKRCIADSEDPKSIDDLNTLGMNVLKAVKGPGSVLLGVNELRNCDIYVVGESTNLVDELNEYQFVAINGKPTNDIIDKKNHLMDAMRYGYTNRHLNSGIKI